MTTTANRIVSDLNGNLNHALDYAQRVARAYRQSGQPGDAMDYEQAAASIQNEIDSLRASALAGSFDLGCP